MEKTFAKQHIPKAKTAPGGNSDPAGFDYWNVLIDQGFYHNPVMIEMGEEKTFEGYATDIITDLSINWLSNRDKDKPFMLMCHHKAPHRPWEPDEKHARLYEDIDIPEPETLFDDYEGRSEAAKNAIMRLSDLRPIQDLKAEVPEGLTPEQEQKWRYQRYIKDYLRCVASIDDNVGRLLDYLEEEGIAEDTMVIYTSDQGFFLGDHGWFDKRFMYEESLRMPFVIRYPRKIKAGTVNKDMLLNLDFAPTFLDYAAIDIPADMQGKTAQLLLEGRTPENWRKDLYYRYWMHCDSYHNVYSHYGIRTERYKLIYYYGESFGLKGSRDEPKEPEWELFDLAQDRWEVRNVYNDPAYAEVVRQLTDRLHALQEELGDEAFHSQR
jgi:arylsulfatase A-like enzyme